MKCVKCKTKLPDDSKYCIRCGALLDDTYFNIKKPEEDLLFEYIINGEVYNTKISIKYLCFNFAYAFYKKMYIVGIISFWLVLSLLSMVFNFRTLLINTIGFIFLPLGFLVWLFILIIMKFVFDFDNMYLKSVYKFVKKTIRDNKGASLHELESICDKRRQNDLFSAIVSVVVFLCFLIL